MGRYDGCSSNVALFYGLYVHSDSIEQWTEAFFRLNRQLAVLDILAARRRSNTQGGSVFDSSSATSRIPEEVWHEIRSSLISQELELLEENAKVGMGKSCGAGKRVKMKPSEKLSCDFQKKYPYGGVCRSCQEYLKYGFRIRENSKKIRAGLLASYNLYPADISFNHHDGAFTWYLGIAVHPPFEQSHSYHSLFYGFAYRAVPLSLPIIDENEARLRVAAFLKDFRVQVKKDPLYEVRWMEDEDVEIQEDLDQYGDEKKTPEERLKERQDEFSSNVPRWMLVHNAQA